MNYPQPSMPEPFSNHEQLDLQALRERYQADRDRFSETERARLGFLRWLIAEGRLDPYQGGDDRSTLGTVRADSPLVKYGDDA